MNKQLKNRVAIITGAARGIGQVVAVVLGEQGATIVPVDLAMDDLENTVERLREKGVTVFPLAGDVSNWDSVQDFTARVHQEIGAIHILVNNAGIQGPIGPLIENDVTAWARTVQVNLLGTFHCCKAVIPDMIRQNYGRIINFSGGGATFPRPNFTAYAASKIGVVRLTETLAEELKAYNICVNAIAPGAVNTHMLQEMLEAGAAAGEQGMADARRQLETGGTQPELAAALVSYLASDAVEGLTGKLIAAPHDGWQAWDSERIQELMALPWMTLRRMDPFTLKPFLEILDH
jgi:NAD(P)-dependent dehydrogenase (short-subunit alcohol dehydrogenase family)